MNGSQEEIGHLLEHWINFHMIYYPLYMLIMQVYHDCGRMRFYGRMPDSGQKI
jgi:hypothetical protein